MEVTGSDPEVKYHYIYFRCRKVISDTKQITRRKSNEENSIINETLEELALLKKLFPERSEIWMAESELLMRQKKYKSALDSIQIV